MILEVQLVDAAGNYMSGVLSTEWIAVRHGIAPGRAPLIWNITATGFVVGAEIRTPDREPFHTLTCRMTAVSPGDILQINSAIIAIRPEEGFHFPIAPGGLVHMLNCQDPDYVPR